MTKKCYPQKIGVLRICKLPSLMCSIPQFENSLIAQDLFYGSQRMMHTVFRQTDEKQNCANRPFTRYEKLFGKKGGHDVSELRQKGKKIIAWVLTFVILIANADLEALAGGMTPYASYLDGWKVDVAWNTMTQNYEWNATADEVRQPKIVATYRMENAEKDYPAGSLSFTIPGIGGVKRSGTVKADKLAADQGDSEWNYTWDPMTDTYQFTNKFEVKTGQSVSGGFELLWTLEARDCENGFQMEAAPTFAVADAGSIMTEPLRFSFTSARDRYRIRMTRQNIDGSTYEKEDKDYTWYDCRMYFDYDWLARGLYRSTMFMAVSGADGLSDGDIIAKVGGNYKTVETETVGSLQTFNLFTEKDGDLVTKYSDGTRDTYYVPFRIGFKTDVLEGKDVTILGHLSRLYNDEEDWTDIAEANECVDVEETFTLHGYHFNHAGYIYNQWSINYNHEMSYMFFLCNALTNLSPLSNWDTSSVTSMNSMFSDCYKLADSSAINNWDILKVTDFQYMFIGCPSHPTFTKRAGTWDSHGTFTPTS